MFFVLRHTIYPDLFIGKGMIKCEWQIINGLQKFEQMKYYRLGSIL